jgi:hypothetical protein
MMISISRPMVSTNGLNDVKRRVVSLRLKQIRNAVGDAEFIRAVITYEKTKSTHDVVMKRNTSYYYSGQPVPSDWPWPDAEAIERGLATAADFWETHREDFSVSIEAHDPVAQAAGLDANTPEGCSYVYGLNYGDEFKVGKENKPTSRDQDFGGGRPLHCQVRYCMPSEKDALAAEKEIVRAFRLALCAADRLPGREWIDALKVTWTVFAGMVRLHCEALGGKPIQVRTARRVATDEVAS